MVWQPEIDELNRRKKFAEQMGGERGIKEQRKRGKLTVRERLALLPDKGSFKEIGELAGLGTYENNEVVHVRPESAVIGPCTIDGRKAVLCAGDFTVRHAGDQSVGAKGKVAQNMALDWKLPFIRLLDATGWRVAGRLPDVRSRRDERCGEDARRC